VGLSAIAATNFQGEAQFSLIAHASTFIDDQTQITPQPPASSLIDAASDAAWDVQNSM
jgi:hypothetical protein